MGSVKSHRDLIVWQKAMDMTVMVYGVTKSFPKTEQFALTQQLTRAAASVPANIAEGNARSSRKEYANFLSIARGSLMETETFITLAVRLGYVEESDVESAQGLVTEISKMLVSLRSNLTGNAE